MKVFKEITEWATPNHIYFLSNDKSKMYAYIKQSGTGVEEFKKPYRFDSKGRRFVEVENSWGYTKPEESVEEEPAGFVKIVIGSKGEKYTITEINGVRHCTCPGYKFRGKCRHTES